MEKLFNDIEALSGEYTEFLKNICTYETTAYDIDEMNKMTSYIEGFAVARGFKVKRTPMDKCGDFLTVDINSGVEKGYIFLAHMDTVHKKGAFGYPVVTVENGRMTGPGTIDCKGGIAIALLTMEALKKNGYKKHARLILTSDEEISNVLGGMDEIKFINASVKGFKAALNCETSRKNEVTISRKGIIRTEVVINGVGGHSGMDYFNASSAVVEAAKKIIELEKNSREGGITYNCSVISGGSTPNCIPDKCSFIVDIRVVSSSDIDAAKSFLKEVVSKSFVKGTKSVIRDISSRPPMEKNDDSDSLFKKLNEISVSLGFGSLIPVASGGGSDSAYTKLAGVVSLCGLGGEGDFCHTNKEYIELESITRRAKLLSALCIDEEI